MKRIVQFIMLITLFLSSVAAQTTFDASTQVTMSVPNNPIAGTTLNKLAIIDANGTASLSGTTDTNVPAFIVLGNAGTSGNAKLATAGSVLCTFDASGGTAQHFVQVSTSVAGTCHDAGATKPTSGWMIGLLLSSPGANANGLVLLSQSSGGLPAGTADGKIPIWNNTSKQWEALDPLMQGTQAAGSSTQPNPLGLGGWDYANGVIRNLAVDPTTKALLTVLPQQSLLNTQMFNDANAASPTRGDIITAQGATPKWGRLAVGTSSQALFGGTEPAWATTTLLNGGFHSDTISAAANLGDVMVGNATPKWSDLAAPITTGTGFFSEIPTYVANPANAPTLTANNSGGSLTGATQYFVKITFSNANGETAGSAEANVTTPTCAVANTCSITVTAPAFSSGATSYSGYLGSATGLEHLSGSCQNIAAGVNCTIPAVGAGGLPATFSTATIVTALQWKKFPQRFANDFPTLQLAIDDVCGGGGGTVYLAGQTYTANSTLNLCSNLRITGDSPAGNDTPLNKSNITTTLSSGALFDLPGLVNVELSRFAVVKSGTAGGTAWWCHWCQYSVIDSVLFKGPFLNGIIMNPIQGASTEFNVIKDVLITGLTTNGIGCLLDSGSVSNANVNSNRFEGTYCGGGTGGVGLKTAGGVSAQPFVNENQFVGGQYTATNGTGVQVGGSVGQPSTRNLTMLAPDIEGNLLGIDLQAANDGFHCWSCNLIINTTNVQRAATVTRYIFVGNFAGASQNYSIDESGNSNMNSISTGGAAPQGNGSINMSAGSTLMASGTSVANVNATDLNLQKMIISAPNVFRVTSDFVTAANTNLQTITGLSWVLPALEANNVPFTCEIMYNQQTAAVTDAFGIQASTFSPTQINAKGDVQTAAGTYAGNNLVALASTTATNIVAFIPSAITTVWNAHLSGMIENPSNASTQTVNIMVKTGTAADAVTVKRGSYCIIY